MAKDVDKSNGRRGRGEINRRSVVRIRCRNLNRAAKLLHTGFWSQISTDAPTPTRTTEPTLATSLREVALPRRLA